MYSYKTKGTCSREIQFDVENNIVKETVLSADAWETLRVLPHFVKDVILMISSAH